MCSIAVWSGASLGNGSCPVRSWIKEHAARVEIAPRVDVLEVALLGRHVRGRADERPGLCQPGLRIGVARDLLFLGDEVGRDQLGDPEVEHLDALCGCAARAFGRAAATTMMSSRLEVAVDDSEAL